MTHFSQLPVNVLESLQRGNTVEAIKLLRDATGLGLKEAKDLIDHHLRGDPVSIEAPIRSESLPLSVQEALKSGSKIEAITLLRERTGMGLKEAKDAVEAFGSVNELAPGEVAPSSVRNWILAAVAIAVLVVGYYSMQ